MTLFVSLGNILIFILILDLSQPRFLIKHFLIKKNECISNSLGSNDIKYSMIGEELTEILNIVSPDFSSWKLVYKRNQASKRYLM